MDATRTFTVRAVGLITITETPQMTVTAPPPDAPDGTTLEYSEAARRSSKPTRATVEVMGPIIAPAGE
jgi:hypothetical protein